MKTVLSKFVDLTKHADFSRLRRAEQARKFGRNVLVACATFIAFVSWDMIAVPERVDEAFYIRLGVAAFCIAIYLATLVPGFERAYYGFYVALIPVASMSVATILSLFPHGFEVGIAGVVLCITASTTLFQANALATALAGGIATLGAVGLMVHFGVNETLVRGHAIFLVTAVGFAVLDSIQSRQSDLRAYEAQQRLANEKKRTEDLLREITEMREQRHAWLENLAGFLRHELKNQLVAVGTSLDLARETDSPAARGTFLGRARRSLNRMRALVSSATEATNLEAALSSETMDVVDLSGVVIDRVRAFASTREAPDFCLRMSPGVEVRGSEERLAQLTDKLLENAAQHTEGSADILVELQRPSNGTVELVVENHGRPLPSHKEKIFEAFVSSRGEPGNLGLGLFIARSIARNHGGDVSAADPTGARGARFTVRLPTGGPAATVEEPRRDPSFAAVRAALRPVDV
ncbi:MAG: HAMP domain-containing sensor histidine kinase [Myxococcota bacterium]